MNWSNGRSRVERVDDPVAVRPDRPRRRRWCSRWCRRSGPGRASAGPTARRSAATRAAGRPPARRRPGDVGLEERVDLLRRRRQAGQVERDAADQRRPVGLRRRRQPLLLQPGEDEARRSGFVPSRDWYAVISGRFGGTNAQCGGVLGPLLDPRLQLRDLVRRQPLAGLGRRHPRPRRSGSSDALDQLALGRLAGHDRALLDRARRGRRAGASPSARAGAVALEAVVRQDRPDVAGEVHRRGGGRRRERQEQDRAKENRITGPG